MLCRLKRYQHHDTKSVKVQTYGPTQVCLVLLDGALSQHMPDIF